LQKKYPHDCNSRIRLGLESLLTHKDFFISFHELNLDPVSPVRLTVQTAVGALKAVAEPTRLRVLVLLSAGELNVKDLTRILGQSQPRISRHLKLLAEAGLVERAPEGSWVYFRLAETGQGGELARLVLERIDRSDPQLVRDLRRAEGLQQERQAAAQTYFQSNAGDWDSIRALHVAEAEVEAAVAEALGPGPFDLFVDLGTGTGRMLELFADRFRRGLGLDLSPAMLAYARAKLERAGMQHAQVRQGDIFDLPLADHSADAVIMHQVLHFLADPQPVLREAARVLAPGGRLLIVDFAPHELEFLREQFAHERLGFAGAHVQQWLADCGLEVLETRELTPPGGAAEGKLTVSMWLAGRPGASDAASRSTDERNLERAT
jgi:ubiquinone/menaquinone biosynthesis C-methylase UbiE/DNA-binding transcriptional ArsR family regulator